MVKISIISPCYNGEKHLEPYINGLLSQTYSNVEYIFVNDGSNDKTEEIINSYAEKLREKGWEFIYIKQEKRGGQAKAINQGLKIFTGDYLCCIDSDDIIVPAYLEEMSDFLENNRECGIAFPWVEAVEEGTYKHVAFYKRNISGHSKDPIFDDFVNENFCENYICYPTFMVRTSALLSIYPERKIYEGISGQNPQLILPILYNYKCGYVKKILFKYLIRKNSDSHIQSTEEYRNRLNSWEDVWCNALKIIPNMPDYEKAYYFNLIKNKYTKRREELKYKSKKKNLSECLLSVTNEYTDGTKHKVLAILGIKFKFRIGKTAETSMTVGGVK